MQTFYCLQCRDKGCVICYDRPTKIAVSYVEGDDDTEDKDAETKAKYPENWSASCVD